MQSKKGAVSLFILIGIVMLFTVQLYFFMNNYAQEEVAINKINEESQVLNEILPVRTYFDQCAKDSLTQAIAIVAKSGGAFYPEPGLEKKLFPLALFKIDPYISYISGSYQENLLTESQVLAYLSEAADYYFKDCAQKANFTGFEFEYDFQESPKVSFQEDAILAEYNSEIKISKHDQTTTIDSMAALEKANLRILLIQAKSLMSQLKENPVNLTALCKTNIISVAYGKELTFLAIANPSDPNFWFQFPIYRIDFEGACVRS